jgi:hypothetical protein
MRKKDLFLFGAFVSLACVQLFLGCQLASPISSGIRIGRPDPLWEEIRKESEDPDARHVVSPAPVLKYIPLGTPIEQAKTLMKAHGFRCSSDEKDSNSYLEFVASKNDGFMMAWVIRVLFYHQAGKVTDVKVLSYLDGP